MELCEKCSGTGFNGSCESCGGSGFVAQLNRVKTKQALVQFQSEPRVRRKLGPNPDYDIPRIKLPPLEAQGHLVTANPPKRIVAVTTLQPKTKGKNKRRKGLSPTQKIRLDPRPTGSTVRIPKATKLNKPAKAKAPLFLQIASGISTFEALCAKADPRQPNLDGAREWGGYRDSGTGQFGSFPAFDPSDMPDD